MRTKGISFLLVTLMLFTATLSTAKPPRVARAKARATMMRTQRVIFAAHRALKQGKVFTGHFRRAVLHQRMARRRFRRGMYWKAIAHSRYARRLARIAIVKNKGQAPKGTEDTAEEDKLLGKAPSDASLDKEMEAELPDDVKEEDLVEMEDLGITVD